MDTGGKAFFDSNDFAPAFQQVQHDTEAYYILGFRSTNQRQDGSYRHLTVKVNREDVKIEYRPGYYAAADFQHQKTEDREEALTEQMRSDLPATDVAVYLQALYFMSSRQLVLYSGEFDCAGVADSVCEGRGSGQGDAGYYGAGEGRAGDRGGECAADGEAGGGCGAAGAAEEHSVLDWLYAGAGAGIT